MDRVNFVGLCRLRGKDRPQTLVTAYGGKYCTGHLARHRIAMESLDWVIWEELSKGQHFNRGTGDSVGHVEPGEWVDRLWSGAGDALRLRKSSEEKERRGVG